MQNGLILITQREDAAHYSSAIEQLGVPADIVTITEWQQQGGHISNRPWIVVSSGTHPEHVSLEAAQTDGLIGMIDEALANDVPVLGLAYGISLIAHALGGVVEDHSERGEAGVVEIHRLAPAEDDVLFDDMPETFRAVAYRHDDIMHLPVQCVPMANSRMAQFHAIKVAGSPMYGLAFDPFLSITSTELTPEEHAMHQERIQRWLEMYHAETANS